jgi:hypothetical protein
VHLGKWIDVQGLVWVDWIVRVSATRRCKSGLGSWQRPSWPKKGTMTLCYRQAPR